MISMVSFFSMIGGKEMHVAKYNANQVGQMCAHYNRNNGKERNYSNQQIDKEKSYLNYNLAPNRGNEVDFINQRIEEVKHINRADVVKMADWVVTLPKDYKGDEREFFQATYDSLENRYGRENVVSAYVHMDETTPHMHFAFVPVAHSHDKEGREVEKLSAKEVLTRNELQRVHGEVEREVSHQLERKVHLLNGKTKEGNRSIDELKRDTAIRDLEKIKDLEKVRDKQLEPVQPKRGLRGEYVLYSQYKEDIQTLNAHLFDKQREITEERRKGFSLVDRVDRAERSAKDEYELRLELQEKLDDKEYLLKHLYELVYYTINN